MITRSFHILRSCVRCGRYLSVLIALVLLSTSLFAQDRRIVEFRIKSAYLNNFVKNVEWPLDAVEDTFKIAILQDQDFVRAFSMIKDPKSHHNTRIPRKVELIDNLDNAAEYQLIYADAKSGYTAENLSRSIKNKPILLVTENYEFGSTMINFIIINNKLQYEVNVLEIESNDLVINNAVLDRAVDSEDEEEFQRALKELRKKLNLTEDKNQEQSRRIQKLNRIMALKEDTLEQKEAYLDSIKADVSRQQKLADELRATVDSNAAEILKKERDLRENDLKLTRQMVELEKAKKNFKEIQDDMSKTMRALENQKLFLMISVLVSLLIAVLLIVAYRSFIKQRKQAAIINRQKEEAEIQRDEIQTQHIQLAEKNKEITDSITYAKRIQDAMLPPMELFQSHLEKSFVFYMPKDIVAGDFYWMESVNDKVIFAAADCTGHGVPGAIVSVICSNALNRSVREFKLEKPSDILDKTLEIVLEKFSSSDDEVKDGMDIALCCWDPRTNEIQYAGANNPLWIIRNGKHKIEEYKADKQPIGKYLKHVPFTNHKTTLEEGDSIYLFSDGFADQFGGEMGKKFRSIHFKELLISVQSKDMKAQRKAIEKSFFGWKGKLDQLDDVCVIGFRA